MAGGSTSFLRIPSNIKQTFAPFQIQKGGGLQVFSFKPSRMQGKAKAGLLNMVPSSVSLNTDLFNKDLSYRLQNKQFNFTSILNTLPCVLIREYLPDTKLDLSLNFFNDIFSGIFKGKRKKEFTDAGEAMEDSTSKSSDLTDRLKKVVDAVMEKIDDAGWLDALTGSIPELTSKAIVEGKEGQSVLKFPFFLYYRLLSCRTTNVYELPCVPSNNAMYSSNGHPGWEGMSGMRLLPDFAKNIPILGKILDSLFGNMGINFTPWWDAAAGSKTPAPEIELKFSLFNDSVEAALANFIFVNTIIAHARWIQYNVMQHSSSLYDVSLAGIGKLYACMANFDVQYKGTLRQPSDKFYSKLKGYVGDKYNGSIVNELTIRIPDVYDVTMKFQSLLPANFNTFVYNFTLNDIMNDYAENPEQESGFSTLTKGIDELVKTATKAW